VIAWTMSDIYLETVAKDAWDLPTPGAWPRYDVLIIAGDFFPSAARALTAASQKVGLLVQGSHWKNWDFDPLFTFEI
jgi:hypothetical protein